jgi:hypothetical protein
MAAKLSLASIAIASTPLPAPERTGDSQIAASAPPAPTTDHRPLTTAQLVNPTLPVRTTPKLPEGIELQPGEVIADTCDTEAVAQGVVKGLLKHNPEWIFRIVRGDAGEGEVGEWHILRTGGPVEVDSAFLKAAEQVILVAAGRLQAHRRLYQGKTVYDRARIGLAVWHIATHFQEVEPTVSNVGHGETETPETAADYALYRQPNGQFASGFSAWIEQHKKEFEGLDLKRSSLYNYMNLARNLGLSLATTSEELDQAEKDERWAILPAPLALLYKSPGNQLETSEDGQETPAVAQAQVNMSAVKLRYLDPEKGLLPSLTLAVQEKDWTFLPRKQIERLHAVAKAILVDTEEALSANAPKGKRAAPAKDAPEDADD